MAVIGEICRDDLRVDGWRTNRHMTLSAITSSRAHDSEPTTADSITLLDTTNTHTSSSDLQRFQFHFSGCIVVLCTQRRPIVTDRVVWSVGLSVTVVSPAKTAEPIEILFGLWPRTGPRNHVLNRGSDPPWEGVWRTRLNLCFLRPTRVHNPNGKLISSAIFVQLTAKRCWACLSMSFPHCLFACRIWVTSNTCFLGST